MNFMTYEKAKYWRGYLNDYINLIEEYDEYQSAMIVQYFPWLIVHTALGELYLSITDFRYCLPFRNETAD